MEKKKDETVQMNVIPLTAKGKRDKAIALDPAIAGQEISPYVLHQYETWHQANKRLGTAKVKDRSEVSGGGKKPWRQKGTGRARHGSTRSPIWRKGGVTFGPKPKDFSFTLPKKIRKAALVATIQLKAVDGKLFVMDGFGVQSGKTKDCAQKVADLNVKKPLLISAVNDTATLRAAKNIKRLALSDSRIVSAHDVMNCSDCVMTKEAYELLVKRITGANKQTETAKETS